MDRSEEAVESVNPRNKGYQLLILRNLSEMRITLQLSQMKRKYKKMSSVKDRKRKDMTLDMQMTEYEFRGRNS